MSLSVTCSKSVIVSGTLVSSTNKTNHHYLTELLLKVALNTKTKPVLWPLGAMFDHHLPSKKQHFLKFGFHPMSAS
jgi:hypothetical protein